MITFRQVFQRGCDRVGSRPIANDLLFCATEVRRKSGLPRAPGVPPMQLANGFATVSGLSLRLSIFFVLDDDHDVGGGETLFAERADLLGGGGYGLRRDVTRDSDVRDTEMFGEPVVDFRFEGFDIGFDIAETFDLIHSFVVPLINLNDSEQHGECAAICCLSRTFR